MDLHFHFLHGLLLSLDESLGCSESGKLRREASVSGLLQGRRAFLREAPQAASALGCFDTTSARNPVPVEIKQGLAVTLQRKMASWPSESLLFPQPVSLSLSLSLSHFLFFLFGFEGMRR